MNINIPIQDYATSCISEPSLVDADEDIAEEFQVNLS